MRKVSLVGGDSVYFGVGFGFTEELGDFSGSRGRAIHQSRVLQQEDRTPESDTSRGTSAQWTSNDLGSILGLQHCLVRDEKSGRLWRKQRLHSMVVIQSTHRPPRHSPELHGEEPSSSYRTAGSHPLSDSRSVSYSEAILMCWLLRLVQTTNFSPQNYKMI